MPSKREGQDGYPLPILVDALRKGLPTRVRQMACTNSTESVVQLKRAAHQTYAQIRVKGDRSMFDAQFGHSTSLWVYWLDRGHRGVPDTQVGHPTNLRSDRLERFPG